MVKTRVQVIKPPGVVLLTISPHDSYASQAIVLDREDVDALKRQLEEPESLVV